MTGTPAKRREPPDQNRRTADLGSPCKIKGNGIGNRVVIPGQQQKNDKKYPHDVPHMLAKKTTKPENGLSNMNGDHRTRLREFVFPGFLGYNVFTNMANRTP
jgi:hypothetical protein